MKTIYRKTQLDKVLDVIEHSTNEGREIEQIELSNGEFMRILRDLNRLTGNPEYLQSPPSGTKKILKPNLLLGCAFGPNFAITEVFITNQDMSLKGSSVLINKVPVINVEVTDHD